MKRRKVSLLLAVILSCFQVMSISLPVAAEEIILDESFLNLQENADREQAAETEKLKNGSTDDFPDLLSVEEILTDEIPKEALAQLETESEEAEIKLEIGETESEETEVATEASEMESEEKETAESELVTEESAEKHYEINIKAVDSRQPVGSSVFIEPEVICYTQESDGSIEKVTDNIAYKWSAYDGSSVAITDADGAEIDCAGESYISMDRMPCIVTRKTTGEIHMYIQAAQRDENGEWSVLCQKEITFEEVETVAETEIVSETESLSETVYSGQLTDDTEMETDVKDEYSGKCGESMMWKFDSVMGILRIEGEGYMEKYSSIESIPWNKYHNDIKKAELSDKIKSISDGAFYNCVRLETVSFSESLETIGSRAFEGCKNLNSVVFPKSLKNIGGSAFKDCTDIKSIIFPDELERIRGRAFENCINLTYVRIPDSITRIENMTFLRCSKLISIDLPQKLESIGICAFESCTSLKNVDFPNTLQSIEEYAFCNCISLTSIVFPENHRVIDKCVFKNCKGLLSVSFSEKLESVGDEAFRGCSSLKSINLPNTLQSIGERAFYDCKGLKSVTMLCSITRIEEATFQNCISLTSIELPQNLQKIGRYAFNGCKELKSIIIPDSIMRIESYVFENCSELSTVYLPQNIQSIDDQAFRGCGNLNSLDLPENLQSIGRDAFGGCVSLTYLDFPDSLMYIGEYAFAGCIFLESVRLSKNIQLIDEYAFTNCGLKSISLPESVQTVGYGAFNSCRNLVSVAVLNKTININNNVFYLCDKIIKVYGYGGTNIETYAETNGYEFIDFASYKHTIKEFIVFREPTCIENGLEIIMCAECGEVEETISALGHIWNEGMIIKEPTCTEIGKKEYHCNREKCDAVKAEIIEAIGHSIVKDMMVAATCEKKGLTEGSHCEVCGKVLEEQKEIQALSHAWDGGKVTKYPTCTETGKKMYYCTRKNCHRTRTEEIQANGHTVVKDVALAATCEKTGLTEGSHCKVCGEVLEEQKEIPELNHVWDEGEVIKNPTCTETGKKAYHCTRENCYRIKMEEIQASGHTVVKDEAVAATCTKAGKTDGTHCSVCGAVLTAQRTVKALGHSWGTGKITTAATCTKTGVKMYLCVRKNCTEKKTEVIAAKGHTKVVDRAITPTCTKAGKTAGSHCSVCKAVLTPQKVRNALGHKWGAWTKKSEATVFKAQVQQRVCSRCKKTEIRNVGQKLTPVLEVSTASVILKTGQTTKVFRVMKMAAGDSVKSWKSSNTAIVKVSGTAQGICTLTAQQKTGTAQLTVTLHSGKTKAVTVKVQSGAVVTQKLTGIPASLVIQKGKTVILKPKRKPLTSTDKITYTSTNAKVVSVAANGKLTANAKGTATITIRAGKAIVRCKVTVK